MLLLNNLYEIVDHAADVYTVRFRAEHPIFAAHFPGHPIVPGACLIQIAEELSSQSLGQPVRFTALRNLKFRHPVTPDQEVTYTIRCITPDINIQISESASFTATYMCAGSDVQ